MIKHQIKKLIGPKLTRSLAFYFLPANKKSLIKKRKSFYLQFLKAGDLYFDVGANYGNRIEPIIDSGIRIIAIEPQIECIKHLKSRFGDKILILRKGLGDHEETRSFHISTVNMLSSFSEEWINRTRESGRFGNVQWNRHEQVEISTLDRLIDQYGLPKFIKIDVEGYELEVLNGLTRSIETISFEYTVPEQTDRALMCVKRIVEISKNRICCNYSIGESMEWALDEWLTPEEMIAEIKAQTFTNSGFGDIYVSSVVDIITKKNLPHQ